MLGQLNKFGPLFMAKVGRAVCSIALPAKMKSKSCYYLGATGGKHVEVVSPLRHGERISTSKSDLLLAQIGFALSGAES